MTVVRGSSASIMIIIINIVQQFPVAGIGNAEIVLFRTNIIFQRVDVISLVIVGDTFVVAVVYGSGRIMPTLKHLTAFGLRTVNHARFPEDILMSGVGVSHVYL